MTERYKQLIEYYASQNLFQQNTIADYFFLKTLLFANSNLLADEKRLFHQLFHTLNARFPDPDLLVYLHRPIPELKSFIHKRGRTMENTIKEDYLEKVQSAYFSFFKTQPDFPVLVLDLEGIDFVQQDEVYQQIIQLLAQPFEKKVHFIKLGA